MAIYTSKIHCAAKSEQISISMCNEKLKRERERERERKKEEKPKTVTVSDHNVFSEERGGKKEREAKEEVNWRFTPSQPVRLYQGDKRERKRDM